LAETDTKYKDVQWVHIGSTELDATPIGAIISLADKLVSPEGDLVKPFAAINDKTPPDVTHHHRYWLVELITDGFNYEAVFTQQVQEGAEEPELSTRAFRQGADNDAIGHLAATLSKIVSGTATVTYESGRAVLSGLHVSVSNRKGRKYQPTTIRFKVRGTRLEE